MPEPTWRDDTKVAEYLNRIDRLTARHEGERALLDTLPARLSSVLDLGCGDGRLLGLVLGAGHPIERSVGIDNSPPMLERARTRFAANPTVSIHEHDLRDPLRLSGPFDLVVSGFAIHHLDHDRKRTLYAEAAQLLRPGGLFVNLEVVQCATPRLQDEFNDRIGRPGGDPEDILAPVGEQLAWLRDAGLVDVDCTWRWRGFALLTGHTPTTDR